MTAPTTLIAWKTLDTAARRKAILKLLDLAGDDGMIYHELRAYFDMERQADGSINTRLSEMERDSLVFRMNDTRRSAVSGYQQTVWRHAKYAPTRCVALPTRPPENKQNPFDMGAKWFGRELVKEIGSPLPTALARAMKAVALRLKTNASKVKGTT